MCLNPRKVPPQQCGAFLLFQAEGAAYAGQAAFPLSSDLDQSRDEKREPKLTRTAAIAATTRELIIQLSRGNADPAQALARTVQAELNSILSSDLDAASTLRVQARQTMFAIEEVLALVDRSDLRGASEAARDAAREWRSIAQSQD
jgi:hypothetical protein